MRKNFAYLFALFFVTIFLVSPVYSVTTKTVSINSTGSIQNITQSFQIRGANVALNVFVPGAQDYNPNAWQLLKDLNINLIRCLPGDEDNVIHININYDANWAQNLDNFLAQAASNGIKVVFYQMGSQWGPNLLLGIVPYPTNNPRLGQSYDPWNGQTIIGTPIADAEVMIDKLAGNNALGHNFITDPRIYGWTVSNEQDLSTSAALNWNIQLLDYIRSKGGQAWVAAPVGGGDYWTATQYASALGSHVNIIELHGYGEYEYINRAGGHTSISDAQKQSNLYNYMKPIFQSMLTTSFSADKVFLGEFGCWLGAGSNEGLNNVVFSNQDRVNVYTAMLNAERDAGLKSVVFFNMFSQTGEIPDYGVVKDPASGSGYWDNNLANTIRTAYTS